MNVLLDVGSTPTISTTMNLVIATITGFLGSLSNGVGEEKKN